MASVLDLVTAEAAAQKVRDEIARNFAGTSPEGEGATHRDPNKLNKEAAVEDYRIKETTED